MKHWIKKLTAAFLAICLTAGGSAAVFASGFEGYEPMEHKELTASDLEYKGWDDDHFYDLLRQLKRMGKDTSDEDCLALYEEILSELDELYDQYVLADAAYYADVNDEKAAEDSDDMYDLLSDAQDEFFLAMQDALHGPKGKLLKGQLQDLWIDWIETYVAETDELEDLYKEENTLVQAYYSAIADVSDIDDYGKYAKEANKACGPIFLELVQVRDAIADRCGYDNYYEYAFDSYGRDYDPEDVEDLCETAKVYLVPLYEELFKSWYYMDYPESVEDFASEEEILDRIEPYIGRIHPDLTEAFSYLRRNRTYDLEYSDLKASTGYTDNLPGYGSAFIFNSPYESYQDYSDLIHEFGHYNAAFHDPTPSVYMTSMLDVAEIHSQGLELLMTHYADDLYGEDGTFMTLDALFRMVNSVLSGCMYDEFQKTVYENPDMDLKEINRLAEQLAEDYGLDGSGYEEYEWVDVSHTFDLPCYYFSYATSALSALDIWRESIVDWDSAVDRYMQVTALDSSTGYLEAVEACGLMDFRDRRAVRVLAEDIGEYYGKYLGDDSWDWFPDASGTSKDIEDAAAQGLQMLRSIVKFLLIIALAATVLVLVIIALLWKSHKGEEITNQTPPNPGYTEDPSDVSSYYQEIRPTTQSVDPFGDDAAGPDDPEEPEA